MRDEFRRSSPSPSFPIPHPPSLIPHPSSLIPHPTECARNEAYDVVAYCAPKVVPVAQLDQSNSLLSCGSQVRILPGTPNTATGPYPLSHPLCGSPRVLSDRLSTCRRSCRLISATSPLRRCWGWPSVSAEHLKCSVKRRECAW